LQTGEFIFRYERGLGLLINLHFYWLF